MRKTYDEGPDTLNRDKLAEVQRGEYRPSLRYRPVIPHSAVPWSIVSLVLIVLAAILATLAMRLSPFLLNSTFATILILAGLIASLVAFVQRQNLVVVLFWPFSGVLAYGVLFFLHFTRSPQILYLVGFGLAVTLAVFLADVQLRYYLLWMSADPRFHRSHRQTLREFLASRHRHPLFVAAVVRIIVAYSAGLALFVTTAATPGLQPVRAAASMIFSAIIFIVFAAWSCRSKVPNPGRRHSFLAVLTTWLAYNPHPFAVGVLRIPFPDFSFLKTPAGKRLPRPTSELPPWLSSWIRVDRNSPFSRRLATAISLFLLTATILPTAYYFPLTMFAPSQWKSLAEVPRNADVDLPSADEIRQDLTPTQARYLATLSEQQRQEYLSLQIRRQEQDAQTRLQQQAQIALFEHLNSYPEAWIPVVFRALPFRATWSLWTLFISFVICLAVPLAVALSIWSGLTVPMVRAAEQLLERGSLRDNAWEGYVHTLQTSRNKTEHASLWMGTHADADYPILLHREALREHAHILGDTGSGKTALALAPMITQLIRMTRRDARASQNNRSLNEQPSSSVVIIDLKGDPALFHGAKHEAARRPHPLPFKWYTNAVGRSTYTFNPFLQKHMMNLGLHQKAQILLDSLGLAHGEGYGRSFFSRANRSLLTQLLDSNHGHIDSFRDLCNFMDYHKRSTSRHPTKSDEAAEELRALIQILASIDAINVTDPELVAHQIDAWDIVRKPQVVYFYFQAAIESATVREIAKLALYSILAAATQRGPSSHQVYLFVDEFQQVASENLEIILRQARSAGIAAILANQTLSDLDTPTANLIPTVQANTRVKQFFASTDLRQQESLIEASGETIDYIQSWSVSDTNIRQNSQETILPRITRNDTIRITDDERLSIVHIPRGKGFVQFSGFPFVLRGDFHISQGIYEQRTNTEWPKRTVGTMITEPEHFYRSQKPSKAKRQKDKEREKARDTSKEDIDGREVKSEPNDEPATSTAEPANVTPNEPHEETNAHPESDSPSSSVHPHVQELIDQQEKQDEEKRRLARKRRSQKNKDE